jgi:hypothetical protein
MAKFGGSGSSVLPGSKIIYPTETISAFKDLLDAPVPEEVEEEITMEESVNLSPPIEGEVTPELSTTDTITEDLSTDFNVGETPVVEKTAEELLTGAFEDPVQRAKERVPALTEVLGITSLTPTAIKNNEPVRVAMARGLVVADVLSNEVGGAKITGNVRTPLEAGDYEAAFAKREGDGFKTPTNPLTKGSNINVGIQALLYNPEVMGASIIDENNMMRLDPDLGMVMSLTTEAFLHQQMLELQPSIEDAPALDADPLEPSEGNVRLTKAQNNERLGREVFMSYQREKASKAGQPTDSYLQRIDQITPQTFGMIGDLAKETYARANPDMLIRDDSDTGEKGKQVYFQLTPLGAVTLDKTAKSFQGLFAQPEVKPLNNPTQSGQSEYEQRMYTRIVTTKRGDLKDVSLVTEAASNYNTVGFVNDPRREAIGNLLAINALVNTKNINNQSYGNMFDIGAAKFQELEAEKERLKFDAQRIKDPEKAKLAMLAAEDYNPQRILQGEREKFINIMASVNRESGKSNYLSYYYQALTGRMAPQQTLYNPGSHKTVRQITGSGNVYKFTVNQGSELETTWKEMMGALLFDIGVKNTPGYLEGSQLSTPERINLFNKEAAKSGGQYDQIVGYGNELLAAANNFDKKSAKEMFINLREAKTPEQVNEMKAMIMQKFNVDPLSTGLKNVLASKKSGEAIHFADYFMDLAKYDAARKSNTPGGQQFSTSITIELDGTTHGPATNAALLGVIDMAKRSGLLTTQDYTVLDEIDMRDAMGDYMQRKIQNVEGLFPIEQLVEHSDILDLAIDDREIFLKKSPMTMGYGQEIESLKMHVTRAVFSGKNGDAIRKIAADNNISNESVITFLHTMLVDSIINILDPKVVAIGRLMKANALFSQITNEVLYFENASGFRSYAAGLQMDPELTTQSSYELKGKDGKVTKVEVQFYKNKAEGSAIRGDRGPGGWASGLIQPVAVQSYDGNMIIRTGTGSSWKNITNAARSHGAKPFVHPIFDAFLVDLGSLTAVRKESNQNWKDSIRNHNYVEKVATDWYQEASAAYDKKVNENPNAVIDWEAAKKISPATKKFIGEGPHRGVAFLFTNNPKKAAPELQLKSAIKRTMIAPPKPANMTMDDYSTIVMGGEANRKVKTILSVLQSKGINYEAKTLTVKEVKEIVDTIQSVLQLPGRNKQTSAEIKRDVAALLVKVDATGREARNIDI